ncbi:MAG TPA: ATP-dependent Clp protease adaptor ClpS [Anaerolineaceae bacterium]|nr:ATP-dependent Clp protease adaptor ClpS [Anaerolineaceae bacterium]
MRSQVKTKPEISPIPVPEEELEPLVRVIIHNDDVTPMDFVVQVLERFFFLSRPDALNVMLTAHYTGMAIVQVLPRAEAQKRIGKAHFAAGMEGYPLHFSLEEE